MSIEHPYYPIIYVRGYAGSQGSIEETVSTPYMGFNKGSTKIRQNWQGDPVRHYFESPLIRLMKDYDYRDAYYDGREGPEEGTVPQRSIFIYRYYDSSSQSFGSGRRTEIEAYAKGLNDKIRQVREAVCESEEEKDDFWVYLVAHSMGGLICRTFLQNPDIGEEDATKHVAKVFTYATPHNGIDFQLVGNVPERVSWNNVNNFNRNRMQEYLHLEDLDYTPKEGREASNLNGQFDPNRFFCLVGTNYKDYEASYGLAQDAVGPMSDGLVKIKNATTYGPDPDHSNKCRLIESPRAFVHRSHSGHYGIVNSESGYQNLKRFLFGNVRVDGIFEMDEITLPPNVARRKEEGSEVRASYHIEATVRVRGADWNMHERTVRNDSAIFRTYDELFKPEKFGLEEPRSPHLFSVFLDKSARVNKRRRHLGFCLDLGVQVPEYEIDGVLFDDHYDGGYLFREKINLEAVPPPSTDPETDWYIKYGVDERTPNRCTKKVEPEERTDEGVHVYRIPLEQNTRPGISGRLHLKAKPVNAPSTWEKRTTSRQND